MESLNCQDFFTKRIQGFEENKEWTKDEIVDLFFTMIPDFGHKEAPWFDLMSECPVCINNDRLMD